MQMKIEIIAGSARKNSLTFRIALFLHRYLSDNTAHEIGIIDCRSWTLPLIESVFTSVENTPEKFKPLAERMFASEGYILVSPEYNGSYSPALKNLLDHFPKQHRKPFAVATGSPGAMGGIRAAQQMQLLIDALFGIGSPYMLIVPQVEKKFDEQGNLIDQAFFNNAHNFITEFIWLAESVNGALVDKLTS
jgi:NAD(P)H-dependent FMN reductase